MFNMAGTVVFIALLGALVAGRVLPMAILFIYLSASVFSFMLYQADQAGARQGVHRIATYKLHLLALLGGWPGAIIARQLLGHTMGGLRFRAVFRLTVAVNCALLAWLLTPWGAGALHWLAGRLG
jgi:uncharacterized membrane protein YsdA (DUF1294 family)